MAPIKRLSRLLASTSKRSSIGDIAFKFGTLAVKTALGHFGDLITEGHQASFLLLIAGLDDFLVLLTVFISIAAHYMPHVLNFLQC